MSEAATSPDSASLPPGVVERDGHRYMIDSMGRLVPIEVVKAIDLLKDQLVRELVAEAEALSALLTKFRQKTLDHVEALRDLLDDQYEVKIGGAGGNIQVKSYDGTLKVEVQIAQRVSYDPEIQSAKKLVDECLYDWSKDVQPEIRAIISDAFNTDQQGSYSRSSLLRLRRYDFKDPRWLRAMQAISDAEVPDGTKTYARFHRRRTAQDKFRQISLDAATA